ncbi:MAG: nitrite reductase [Candidatus Rokuibacteriota bacterium]
MSETVVRETKAQRVERLKRELNPWAAYSEIERFAREGFEAIPAEWLGTYFRWWGIYTQGDGAGAVGGKGGEGRAVPYFMLRIRIPNGIMTAAQLRVLADLAERHARGVADLTVRQNVQLHWVRIEDLPTIFSALGGCGLSSLGTCGDVTRNVTGCALAGLDADEIVDASPLVHAVTAMVNGSPEFYNLPRKYKVSITGCRVWCSYPEINDVGLSAVRDGYRGHVGYSLRVGGGLSTQPRLASRLDAFVRPDQVLAVVKGVSEIFRDSDVLRQNREKARLKFLFLDHGWTSDRFLHELETRLGFRLDPAVAETLPDEAYRDHVGIHPQKQAGLVYAGLPILRGRLTPPEMRGLAALADRFGTGELRATTMQNLVIVNVPRARAGELEREVDRKGFRLDGSPFRRGTVACTGSEFCKLALTETKGFAGWLVEQLEDRLPGFQEHVRINVTGCPNSCGQHWIADIGIEGKKVKVDGRLVDAYYFCVGGAVGRQQAVARPIGYRIPAPEVPEAVERLLRAYVAERREGQTFRAFCADRTDEEIRTFLAGAEVAAVTRDASPGPVPQGLDG